jgi:CO/xanthine dehydrogenase Mo-binding subunit
MLVEYVNHEPPVPTGFWRSVGPGHNVFVVESFVDELAAAAGRDPVDYRAALLARNPRALAVLKLAAEKAGWGSALPPSTGRGVSVQFAFGTYLVLVTEVAVNEDGVIDVRRVTAAVDPGIAVNPDTIAAQIQSAVIFGISAALYGDATLAGGRIEQSNFHDVRVVRINEVPRIDTHIVPSKEAPGGMGEPGTSALFPSLANAVFAATGKRLRTLPLSSEALKRT